MSKGPAHGTSVLVSQSMMSGVLRLANVMVLTRLLLQSQMGQIALLSVIYGFLQFLGTVGLTYAAPYFVAHMTREGRSADIHTFLRKALRIVGVTAVLLVLIFLLLIAPLIGPAYLDLGMILLIAVIAPFSSLDAFLDSFLLARYQIRPLAAGRLSFDILRVAFTVTLVLMGVGVYGVLVGWLVGELFAVVFFSVFAGHGLPRGTSLLPFGPILAFALPNLMFQTIDVTIQNADRLILLHLTDLAALGTYDVMLGLLFMMSFFSLAVSTSVYPVFARISANARNSPESGSFERDISLVSRYLIVILAPIGIMVALNAHLVLQMLFGAVYADYSNASLSFGILAASYVLWGITYSMHTSLRSIGEKKFFLVIGIAVILSEIVSSWFLTQWFGLLGVSLVRAAYIMALFLTAWKRLSMKGYSPFWKVGSTLTRVIPVSLVAALIPFILMPSSLLLFFLVFIVGYVFYFVMLVILREFKPSDYDLACSVLPERICSFVQRIERAVYGDA